MLVILAFFSLASCVCEPVFADYFYGTPSMSNHLWRIDPADASKVDIGNLFEDFAGLAYVPEPSTLLLLSLGVVMLRRQHS